MPNFTFSSVGSLMSTVSSSPGTTLNTGAAKSASMVTRMFFETVRPPTSVTVTVIVWLGCVISSRMEWL